MSVLKRLLGLAGLVLFGLLLALLVGEAGLRLSGPPQAELGPTFDRPSLFYQRHHERDHPWTRGAEEKFRVAVVGDSFAAGDANHWDDAYPQQLERLLNLNQGAVPAEVVVFARPGTATRRQWPLFNRAVAWGPDLIIVGIFLNDTEDDRDGELRGWHQRMVPRVPAGWKARVVRSSRVLSWLYQRVENLRVRRVLDAYYERVYDPEYSGWQHFEAAVWGFGQTARAAEIDLVAVIFPGLTVLGSRYPYHEPHRKIRQALDKAEVTYLDLLDVFIDKSPTRMEAFPGFDGHPSEIGHRVAAHAIFDFLLEEGILDASYRPQVTKPGRSRQQWLELVRRMRSPAHLE